MSDNARVNWEAMREEYDRKYAKYYAVILKEDDGNVDKIILTPANSKWHERAIVELKKSFEHADADKRLIIVTIEGEVIYANGERRHDEWLPSIIEFWHTANRQPWMEHDRIQHQKNLEAHAHRLLLKRLEETKNKST